MLVRLSTRCGRQQRQALGDHAAHADADHMRLVDPQRIEHAQRVSAMSLQAVRRLDAPAEPVFQARPEQVGLAQRVEVLAQADIAVVKAHHPVAGIHQRLHQRGRPGDQLHAQAHDEQHGRARPALRIQAGAAVLDFDIDAVCSYFHSCIRSVLRAQSGYLIIDFRLPAGAGTPAGPALTRWHQSHNLSVKALELFDRVPACFQ